MKSAISGRPRNGRRGRLAVPLLILALLVQGLMPPGFMPAVAAEADGGLVLVICSPEGVSTLRLDAQGRPLDPDEDTQEGLDGDPALRCVVACGGAAQLAPTSSFAGPAGLTPASAEIPRPRPERLPQALTPGPLGSRAPPRPA